MSSTGLLNPSRGEPAIFVLPVTRTSVDDMLASDDSMAWFEKAPRLHVASIYIVTLLPRISSNPDKAAKVAQSALSDILKQLSTPAAVSEFRGLAARMCAPGAVREGLDWLARLKIGLQDDIEWDAPSPTKADGTLNSDYVTAITNRRLGKTFFSDDPKLSGLGLNVSQTRIATAILGDPEEPVHVQGFAGTGKTHMIRALLRSLPAEQTVVLAKTQGQLKGMLSDSELQNVNHLLLGEFAQEFLIANGVPPDRFKSETLRSSYNQSDETIAAYMRYRWIGDLAPAAVAKAVRTTLFLFCESDSDQVTAEHLPQAYKKLAPQERTSLIKYTQEYWNELIQVDSSLDWQPIRHYHLIKWASLVPRVDDQVVTLMAPSGERRKVKFAIIDEAHDLTLAMRRLLDRSGVVVYSLGDAFQNLQGSPAIPEGRILRRDMTLSMRAGSEINRVVNPVLDAHPQFRDMEPLEGSRDLKTECLFYGVRRIPQTPYAILCGSYFHVFEYLHQLINEGASVSLLPNTVMYFHQFVDTLFALRRGRRGSSSMLFKYRSWDQLRASYGRMKAFGRIEKMMEKGYSETDFRNIMSKVLPMGQGHYVLGRAEDSKNWQFPNVMLSPELFPKNPDPRYAANNLSVVYLAATRAQRTLAVPEMFHAWIDSQSKNSTR